MCGALYDKYTHRMCLTRIPTQQKGLEMKKIFAVLFSAVLLSLFFGHPVSAQDATSALCVSVRVRTLLLDAKTIIMNDKGEVLTEGVFQDVCVFAPQGSVLKIVLKISDQNTASTEVVLGEAGMSVHILYDQNGAISMHFWTMEQHDPREKE